MRKPREHSPWSAALAAQVRAERAAADITQAEVIERTGISRSTYVRIEAGGHVLDTTELGRLCEAFGVSLSEFVRRAEERVSGGDDVGMA